MAADLAIQIVNEARRCCDVQGVTLVCTDERLKRSVVLRRKLTEHGNLSLSISSSETRLAPEICIPWEQRRQAVRIFISNCTFLNYALVSRTLASDSTRPEFVDHYRSFFFRALLKWLRASCCSQPHAALGLCLRAMCRRSALV